MVALKIARPLRASHRYSVVSPFDQNQETNVSPELCGVNIGPVLQGAAAIEVGHSYNQINLCCGKKNRSKADCKLSTLTTA